MNLNEYARRGIFYINAEMLEENADMAKKVFGSCLIISAKFDMSRLAYKYIALNEDFKKVGVGDSVPEYVVEIVDGQVKFS